MIGSARHHGDGQMLGGLIGFGHGAINLARGGGIQKRLSTLRADFRGEMADQDVAVANMGHMVNHPRLHPSPAKITCLHLREVQSGFQYVKLGKYTVTITSSPS